MQAPQLSLDASARMMRHEIDDPLVDVQAAQVSCTVDRVESNCREFGRVTNIVQQSRRSQQRIDAVPTADHLIGPICDPLDVSPPARKLSA